MTPWPSAPAPFVASLTLPPPLQNNISIEEIKAATGTRRKAITPVALLNHVRMLSGRCSECTWVYMPLTIVHYDNVDDDDDDDDHQVY